MSEEKIGVEEAESGFIFDVVTDRINSKDWPVLKVGYGDENSATRVDSDNPLPITSVNTISAVNSRTAATLAAAAVFQGTVEDVSNFSRVGVSITSDNATDGVLTMEVSHDNVTWGGPTRTWSDTRYAQPHMWNIVEKYFRIKYTNGTTEATNLSIQTQYSNNSDVLLGHQLNETLLDETEAVITRSVLVGKTGSGRYVNAVVTDHQAMQVTPPQEGKSAFGEALNADLTPVLEADFHTFINPITLASRENQSGAVTHADQMAVCTTGAAANSSAAVLTKQSVRYHAGLGIRARVPALFTTGVANSIQLAGIGDEGNGLFFGYDGATFGILHRTGGAREMRTLTVTTASSTAENITITLDGDADATVAVTNTADVTLTANEIAAHDYSDVGRGWDATVVGDEVCFTSWNDESRTGTYSLSGTTAIGSFAQTIAGVSQTDDWTPQASWNGQDKFDGNGLSGVTLDPTKGNVYQISYQGGFGATHFFIQDPDDGEFHNVHTIDYANQNIVPSIAKPSLALRISAENFANTSSLVVKSPSMAAAIDGKDEYIGSRLGVKNNITIAGTVETPVLSIRCMEAFQGVHNHGYLKIALVGAAVDHTKAVAINFYANPALTGADFTPVNANASQAQVDIAATAFSGGTFLFSIDLNRTGNDTIDLASDKFAGLLTPGNYFTATAAPTSGNGADAVVSFNFIELF